MFVGFGCNVPAMMAARTIRSRTDRLTTVLVIPFMSCAARLPVYILFVAAFFPEKSGLMLFMLYLIGIAVAVIASTILRKTILKGSDEPFVMELPPYRIPTAATTVHHMWRRASHYLKKVGGIILVVSIIVWALSAYPENVEYHKDYDADIAAVEETYEKVASAEYASDEEKEKALEEAEAEKEDAIGEIEIARESEHIEHSYMGRMGKFVEPIFAPLGFDWRMSVSLLTGVAAKEVVVSTMGVLYSVGSEFDDDESSQSLIDRLNGGESGTPLYTPLVVMGFLLFVLLYTPCFAALAMAGRETGSWKWAFFTFFYTTAIGWIVAFLVYQIGGRIMS
jgi:ferrous iron transport protein B